MSFTDCSLSPTIGGHDRRIFDELDCSVKRIEFYHRALTTAVLSSDR